MRRYPQAAKRRYSGPSTPLLRDNTAPTGQATAPCKEAQHQPTGVLQLLAPL